MRLVTLLIVSFFSCGPLALAQQLKLGVSAGLVRSFVYPQGFSTTNRYDYVHAQGQWGYLAAVQAQQPIGRKTALDLSLRFVHTPSTYDLLLVVPDAFQITHSWSSRRRAYQLYAGISQRLTRSSSPQVRVFGGIFADVEKQRLQLESTSVSSYRSGGNDITVQMQYTTHPTTVWGAGAEAGVGLRVGERVELNLRYNYHFTPTAGTEYASLLTYSDPPGGPRRSAGTLQGRALFAAAEVVVWVK